MPNYRRAKVAGGTYFFTVTLADRKSDLLIKEIGRLRRAYADVVKRLPFETVAICVLPDHLHAIWSLPVGDDDFAKRWSLIKSGFSRGQSSVSRSVSQIVKREKGIWQRRYWEHLIRDEIDLVRHVDYIHLNPVKHGLVSAVAQWPHSSFHRYVKRGDLPADWGGDVGDTPSTKFGE
ncbi:MAG: transposase [Burkholderiales bacterium]|nr:transposase [Burkholderiales bacterium]MCW5692761.1 transposase [Pseudolabrys sp.]